MIARILSVFSLACAFLAGYEVNTLIGHSQILTWIVMVGVTMIAFLVSLVAVSFPKRKKRSVSRKTLPPRRASSRKRRYGVDERR